MVKCYSEALALLGDGLECLQQVAPWIFVGVAGVTKPGLKGEWVIRTAHLVFHRVVCCTCSGE